MRKVRKEDLDNARVCNSGIGHFLGEGVLWRFGCLVCKGTIVSLEEGTRCEGRCKQARLAGRQVVVSGLGEHRRQKWPCEF